MIKKKIVVRFRKKPNFGTQQQFEINIIDGNKGLKHENELTHSQNKWMEKANK